MYKLFTANKKTEKRLRNYMNMRGRLAGKWSCWLGGNIRIIYRIDDLNKLIIVESVGTHKVY